MQLNFNTIFWLGVWYLVSAGFIAFFVFMFRFINMPRFRDDHGDRTAEVGYFEDAVGHVIVGPLDDQVEEDGALETPHVQACSNSNCGMI